MTMAQWAKTNTQHYENIAAAIRAKNGGTETYTPAQMAAAIAAIPSGASIDAVSGSSLPATVVNDQVYIITSTTPGTIYIDTDMPSSPASGDAWVVVAEGGVGAIAFTEDSPLFRVGFKAVKQYGSNGKWSNVEAYLGVSGAWVKIGVSLPPAGTPLNNFTWAQIDYISENGLMSDYFNIGDTKNVTIGSATYVVEIVGFSHDDRADGSGKAGLTFGLKDCLNTAYQMNSSNTNAGGWGSCALRATLRGDIWNQLPSDLRGVIKEVTKKTSAGNSSSTINSISDTLFLFAEKEIFGSTQYSVNGEGTQYARFTTSNTRIKKLNGSATNWWLRSPGSSNGNSFCAVYFSGAAHYYGASVSFGVAFGFCV